VEEEITADVGAALRKLEQAVNDVCCVGMQIIKLVSDEKPNAFTAFRVCLK
jgi:hypothetical protein